MGLIGWPPLPCRVQVSPIATLASSSLQQRTGAEAKPGAGPPPGGVGPGLLSVVESKITVRLRRA